MEYLMHMAGKLVLVVGGKALFCSMWASPQGCGVSSYVAADFHRTEHSRKQDRSCSAFHDLIEGITDCLDLPFYIGHCGKQKNDPSKLS